MCVWSDPSKSSLPGWGRGQGGKPQSAPSVIPQSKGDERLPALRGLHFSYKTEQTALNVPEKHSAGVNVGSDTGLERHSLH